MKTAIAKLSASNVQELIDALKSLSYDDPRTVYVGPVILTLIEEVLSDRSVVYNIELQEVQS